MDKLLQNNRIYAEQSQGVSLQPVPSEGLIILTCMDVRIDPLAVFGLAPGSAHVLRNAGARVTEDVIRSIMVSYKLMRTNRVIILHHTHCGLSKVTTPQMRKMVTDTYEPANQTPLGFDTTRTPNRPIAECDIDFDTFDDQRAAIAKDIFRLAWNPLVPPDMKVDGMLLDVDSGLVEVVGQACRATIPPNKLA